MSRQRVGATGAWNKQWGVVVNDRLNWLFQLSGERLVISGEPATLHDEMMKEVAGMPTTPLIALPEGLDIIVVSEDTRFWFGWSQIEPARCAHCVPLPLRLFIVTIAGNRQICPVQGDPFDCCSPSASSFAATHLVCERSLQSGSQSLVSEPASRLTSRMRLALQTIGFALNGEGGARLANHLGMPISATTLLRSLHLVRLLRLGK